MRLACRARGEARTPLLHRRDALLLLNALFDALDGVRRLDVDLDLLACQRLHLDHSPACGPRNGVRCECLRVACVGGRAQRRSAAETRSAGQRRSHARMRVPPARDAWAAAAGQRASGAQRKAQRGVRAQAIAAQRRVVRHRRSAESEALRVHRHAAARLRAAERGGVSAQAQSWQAAHASAAHGACRERAAEAARACALGTQRSCALRQLLARACKDAATKRTDTACFSQAPVASRPATSTASVPHGELTNSCGIVRLGSGLVFPALLENRVAAFVVPRASFGQLPRSPRRVWALSSAQAWRRR